ncbi:MAG TPA: lysophospholipid acyltransferase family protein [Ignavibacteria bacterium]|nr:lysophospholipid acyltransferase family protein [Ignavibacteria bacterium]
MNFLVFVIFIILEKLVPLFPLRFLYFMARIKAIFFYYFLPIRKRVAFTNLRFAFPEKSDGEIRNIIKKCYLNILIVLVEFFYARKFNYLQIEEKFNIINAQQVIEKLKNGKGVIFVSAHFGNWELIAYSGALAFCKPVCVIVKEQSNKQLDKRINNIREYNGNRMIEMKKAAREVLKALKGNDIVAILGDQSAPAESVKVNFLGKEITAFEGPAVFALKTGAPVFWGVPVRDENYNYSLEVIEIDTSMYKEYNAESIKDLTQRTMTLLEESIKKHPDHWLWFHKRFKSVISYD